MLGGNSGKQNIKYGTLIKWVVGFEKDYLVSLYEFYLRKNTPQTLYFSKTNPLKETMWKV